MTFEQFEKARILVHEIEQLGSLMLYIEQVDGFAFSVQSKPSRHMKEITEQFHLPRFIVEKELESFKLNLSAEIKLLIERKKQELAEL